MNFQNLSAQERVFAARAEDAVLAAARQNRGRQIGFLDERQRAIAAQVCRSSGFYDYRFWGGYPEASRVLFGCFPDYIDPDAAGDWWELTALTFSFRRADKLSHRDFLGALMALGIKRETIGDILVGEGVGVLFALPSAARLIQSEIVKIGRVGVQVQEGMPEKLPLEQDLLPREGTIASPRLDAVTAFLAGTGRDKAQQMIRQGLVSVNFETVEDVSRTVEENSRISIRGYGRFLLERFDGLTKKGRLHLKAFQYQ